MGWSVNRPTGLTHHQPNLSTKGYTLLTPGGGDVTYLIDIHGRVVHQWKFDHIKPGYGRLLRNGNLLMTGSDNGLEPPPNHDDIRKPPPPFEERVRMLGGYHTTLCEVDWHSEVVWEYVNPYQHHDFYRFDNGNTLVPIWVELPDEMRKRVRGGLKRPRETLPPLIGDELLEINPAGDEVRRIDVWQLLDPVKDPIFPSIRRWEWTHVNGIDVNAAGQVVFSARHVNRLGIIDAAGALEWTFDQTQAPAPADLGARRAQRERRREHPRVRQRPRRLPGDRDRPARERDRVDVPGQAGVPVLQRPHLRGGAVADTQRPRLRRHERPVIRGDPGRRGRLGVDQPIPEHRRSGRTHGEHLPCAPLCTGPSGLKRSHS